MKQLLGLILCMSLLMGCNTTNPAIASETILIDKQIQVQEDQYYYAELDFKKTTKLTVSYEMVSGPHIDVYVLDAYNLNRYEDNMKFSYYNDLSTFGLDKAERSATLNKGEYRLLIDNSDSGAVSPPMNAKNDIATLDLKVISQ